MCRLLVVVALIVACRGENPAPSQGSAGSGSGPATAVPKLPYSDDGAAWMRGLDDEIRRADADDVKLVGLLLERASIRGILEDYTRGLARARDAVNKRPDNAAALAVLARAQLAVHAFDDARTTIAKLTNKTAAEELQLGLDQAIGNLEPVLAARKARVAIFPDAVSVTLYAAALREAGRAPEGIAMIPTAVENLRNNTPTYFAFLLFQWGLLYEQAGATATARDFYAETHRRLPAHVEATVHLADTLAATGDTKAARALVAVDAERHPALLAVAAALSKDPSRIAAATAAWERYVTALPAAFADHAARFYLGAGANPVRALALARINRAARDTPAARALVIDAALAAGDPTGACAEVGSLVTTGPRRERFAAWRALTACGRTEDADRLARELGITPSN